MNYQAITDNWTKSVVVDLGLCPFAWTSISQHKLSKKVVLESDIEQVMEKLMEEIFFLEANPNIESSLITFPNAMQDFDTFLDAKALAIDLLAASGFEGVYQLATFHPEFVFEGSEADDASNYTNRSPFPIFHPIRESAMTQAIDSHPDIDSVSFHNITKTRDLGLEYMKVLFNNCFKTD